MEFKVKSNAQTGSTAKVTLTDVEIIDINLNSYKLGTKEAEISIGDETTTGGNTTGGTTTGTSTTGESTTGTSTTSISTTVSNTKSGDTSTTSGKLPKTGENDTIIIAIIGVAVIGIASFVGYRKYRGI